LFRRFVIVKEHPTLEGSMGQVHAPLASFVGHIS